MASWRERIGWAAVAALGMAAVAGGVGAIALRLGMGGGHPPYSTFRTDPLGASVLREAFASLPGVVVEQNVEHVDRLAEAGAGTTLVVAGVPADLLREPMDRAETDALETFLLRGGRLVVLLEPGFGDEDGGATNAVCRRCGACPPDAPSRAGETNAVPPILRERRRKAVQAGIGRSAADLWGIRLAAPHADRTTGVTNAVKAAAASAALPATLPLAGRSAFGDVATNGWTVLYELHGRPVVVERSRFKGTIVFCSDSYAICNEGVWRHRRAEWLAWLMGANRRVIFDETHLGSARTPGLMGLVRRLRLQGFFIALAVLGILVLWREASPLAPPVSEAEGAEIRAGRDSQAGLVALLRRGVKPAEAARHGLERWLRTAGRDLRGGRRERIERLIEEREGTPGEGAAALHRRAREIANERD
jgi:hypothetical protein